MSEVKVNVDGWIYSERAQRASELKSIESVYFFSYEYHADLYIDLWGQGHMLKLVLTVWVLYAAQLHTYYIRMDACVSVSLVE